MNWNKKKVLVTGAGGFIGSHLIEKLVKLGVNMRALIRYNSRNDFGLIEILPNKIKAKIDIVAGDLRDSETIREIMKDREIIFHLGALIDIPYSYLHPREVVQTNVMGTLNILTAAKDMNIERIIHTSTSEVYGTAQYSPIDEKHFLQGQSPYSATKIAADKLAESFYCSFNLPITTIRPFNTYGPRQSARAIIPTIITQMLTKKEIFLGSLSPTRDFTYVSDTVESFIKAAQSDKSIGEVINVGSNFEISVGSLVEKISYLIGKKVKITCDKKRIRPKKSEVGRLIADNSKAKGLIDWSPKITIDNGLKKTIEWIEKNIKLYKINIYNI